LHGLPSGVRTMDDDNEDDPRRSRVRRRTFLGASLAAVPAIGLASTWTAADTAAGESTLDLTLDVNGQAHRVQLEARTTLLDALRESLDLTGAKKGCDQGQCGACTVLLGDRRVLSCLTLACAAAGERITTIEGLARGETLHPLQSAFIEHDGFQCGYCTPGQILSAVGLLAEGCPSDPAAVRECMSGNLCRCGAYPGIVDSVLAAKKETGR
jgi:xanthine dehydrogenase YagT iron-sulfur-binding subunit